ncbi:hypothetical protein LguiB_004096 [Lonicera macranthoides]
MDRMFQNAYVPFVTFYAAIKDTPPPILSIEEPSPAEQQLKRSLAETLTRFYPFAGRANNHDYTIDCNDKGVLFSTARVRCQLRDVLKEMKIEEFHKFVVPYPPTCQEYSLPEDGPTLIGVQLNVFDCGGLALSMFISHLICDVVTLTSFMKCWSGITRESANQVVYPIFSAAEPFLQGEEALLPADDTSYVIERSLLRSEGYAVIRRFVFDGHTIKSLQDKARSEHVPNPTRVEAVSMFIWKHCMAASVVASGTHQPSVLSFLVDLRRRMVPPLSEYLLGNIVWKIMTCSQTQDEIDVDGLVTLFRAAMEENREVTVPKIQNNGGQVAVLNYFEELKEMCRDTNLILYNISSWCRIGLNEVDFGWGKRVWVSQVGAKYLGLNCANSAMLLDGDAAGDNIELWLILDHREMAVLETDPEFLAFASPNPRILI